MIQGDYAKEVAIKFCKAEGIDLNGVMTRDQQNAMGLYVSAQMEAVRRRTRDFERDKKHLFIGEAKNMLPKRDKFESPIEDFLYNGLVAHGLDKYFEPQVKIGKFRVDFACKEAMVVVECDGHQYHFTEKTQIERDQKRDKYLAREGWRVLHIEGIAIRRNIHRCVEKVKEMIEPFIKEET